MRLSIFSNDYMATLYLLWWGVYSDYFIPTSYLVCLILSHWVLRVFSVFWNKFLSHLCFVNNVSQFLAHLLSLLTVFFTERKILILIKFNLSIMADLDHDSELAHLSRFLGGNLSFKLIALMDSRNDIGFQFLWISLIVRIGLMTSKLYKLKLKLEANIMHLYLKFKTMELCSSWLEVLTN